MAAFDRPKARTHKTSHPGSRSGSNSGDCCCEPNGFLGGLGALHAPFCRLRWRSSGVSSVRPNEAEIRVSGVINVGLADDHRVVTHALRLFFESFQDIRVVGTASSGEELVARISEWTMPGIVVLDLLMPGGIDGIETTRRLFEMFPTIRVVALTASTDDARMTAVLRVGATGYVRKDAEPELLLRAVRAVADGRS